MTTRRKIMENEDGEVEEEGIRGGKEEEEEQKKKKTSTTPSCRGPIPAQKSRGKSVLGLYFPTRCPKWIFIILIVLVEKKHT